MRGESASNECGADEVDAVSRDVGAMFVPVPLGNHMLRVMTKCRPIKATPG